MKTFVVMGNDFPDAVFASEDLAEAYCVEQRKLNGKNTTPHIYWKVYAFDLQGLLKVRHLKRGSTYEILGEAQLQTDVSLSDLDRVVVYRCDETGELWVRRHAEFSDGRFENV